MMVCVRRVAFLGSSRLLCFIGHARAVQTALHVANLRASPLRCPPPTRIVAMASSRSSKGKGKESANGEASLANGGPKSVELDTPDWFKPERVRCLTDVTKPKKSGARQQVMLRQLREFLCRDCRPRSQLFAMSICDHAWVEPCSDSRSICWAGWHEIMIGDLSTPLLSGRTRSLQLDMLPQLATTLAFRHIFYSHHHMQLKLSPKCIVVCACAPCRPLRLRTISHSSQ